MFGFLLNPMDFGGISSGLHRLTQRVTAVVLKVNVSFLCCDFQLDSIFTAFELQTTSCLTFEHVQSTFALISIIYKLG